VSGHLLLPPRPKFLASCITQRANTMLAIIETSGRARAYTNEERKKKKKRTLGRIRWVVFVMARMLYSPPGILGATTRDRCKSESASRKRYARPDDPETRSIPPPQPLYRVRIKSIIRRTLRALKRRYKITVEFHWADASLAADFCILLNERISPRLFLFRYPIELKNSGKT